jgi:hypothetical protein
VLRKSSTPHDENERAAQRQNILTDFPEKGMGISLVQIYGLLQILSTLIKSFSRKVNQLIKRENNINQ